MKVDFPIPGSPILTVWFQVSHCRMIFCNNHGIYIWCEVHFMKVDLPIPGSPIMQCESLYFCINIWTIKSFLWNTVHESGFSHSWFTYQYEPSWFNDQTQKTNHCKLLRSIQTCLWCWSKYLQSMLFMKVDFPEPGSSVNTIVTCDWRQTIFHESCFTHTRICCQSARLVWMKVDFSIPG